MISINKSEVLRAEIGILGKWYGFNYEYLQIICTGNIGHDFSNTIIQQQVRYCQEYQYQ